VTVSVPFKVVQTNQTHICSINRDVLVHFQEGRLWKGLAEYAGPERQRMAYLVAMVGPFVTNDLQKTV